MDNLSPWVSVSSTDETDLSRADQLANTIATLQIHREMLTTSGEDALADLQRALAVVAGRVLVGEQER